MSHGSLIKLLNSLAGVRALVIGDVMLDRYVYGDVDRISPEAPIPIIVIDRTEDMPGGAGNVVRNLIAFGARTSLIGVVGDDEWAESLRRPLSGLENVDAHLISDGARPTTVKTRYIADSQQVVRADRESCKPLSADVEHRVIEQFNRALLHHDVVILSDYAKGVLSASVCHDVISKARSADKIVVVDPKARTFENYRGAHVLTPNRLELQLASESRCVTDEEVVAGALRILRQGICETMVVTRGQDGMSVVRSNGDATHLRTTAKGVFDVSGAGDTVVAALSLSLAAGADVVDCATVANIAAGIVVGKRGTSTVSIDELVASLKPIDGYLEHGKIFSIEVVQQLAKEWRDQGLSISFTNGCFDLLHPGHVSLLNQARRSADKLIVGLNSDASVRRLKGPQRPVQGEIARATVLASLKSVDAVVIFPDDTPLGIIEALRPNVLVKGADYTLANVVGADLVRGYGGRVELAELIEGHSTTETLKRVDTTGRR